MSSRLTRDEALEKEVSIDEMKKIKNSPPVPHLLQAQKAPALLYAKVVGCPALEATQHHRPTKPPILWPVGSPYEITHMPRPHEAACPCGFWCRTSIWPMGSPYEIIQMPWPHEAPEQFTGPIRVKKLDNLWVIS